MPVPLASPGTDPQHAAEQQRQRQQAVEAVLQLLMARWPLTFSAYPAAVRPLARGIDKDLVAQVPGSSRRQIGFALAWWQRQRRPAYWRALARGGPRYDLEGHPRGAVTPTEQASARQLLAEYYARRQTRRVEVGRTEGSRPATGPASAGVEVPDMPAPESDS
jgi:sRNA-binding protein